MKLPPIAFAFYLSLGTGRTYQRVAERFGVSRQAVARRALKDRWQDQVAKAEEKARQRAVQEATDSLESMNERHLKTAQLIQKKAIERLRDSSDLSVMEVYTLPSGYATLAGKHRRYSRPSIVRMWHISRARRTATRPSERRT